MKHTVYHYFPLIFNYIHESYFQWGIIATGTWLNISISIFYFRFIVFRRNNSTHLCNKTCLEVIIYLNNSKKTTILMKFMYSFVRLLKNSFEPSSEVLRPYFYWFFNQVLNFWTHLKLSSKYVNNVRYTFTM